MSSNAAPRCQHIKVSGIQCGSPALRKKNLCFYHQKNRPLIVDCYYNPDEYPTGEINLPPFEDAHSIQSVIRQVVQMVLQKRLERKTASLMLYALQIASSNLKRMDLEKPQPAEIVTDPETTECETMVSETTERETMHLETESETPIEATNQDQKASEELPPGTIQACYRPESQKRNRQSYQRKKEYVI